MASQEKSGCRSPSQSSSSSIETLDVSELVASLESSEIYETEEIKEEQQEAAEESEAEELEEPIPDLPQYHISLEIHSTDTWSTHYTSQELSNKRYTPQDPEVPIEYYLVPMSVILCTAGYDHTIRFWEALSGICSRTIQHPDSQVNRLSISPDKKFLAAAGHHTVKLYDIKSTNPNPLLTFEGHTGNITGVAFHCEGKWMVTSSEDGSVKIWETRTGTVQRSYAHGSPVSDVVIHPNQGEIIACDRSGSVRIWDLAENNCSHQLIPEEDVPVASVTVASDGSTLCAGTETGNVYVWHLVQLREKTQLVPITHFKAHAEYITRVLLSPDVKHLATCSSDHTAKIWEVKDLKIPPPGQAATESKPFNLESTLGGHQRWVWDCAFSADSAYLVTACSDHYARLWELHSQQIIRQYNGHHRGLVCVALNDYSEAR